MRASRVIVDCIASGALRRRVFLNPYHASAYSHDLLDGYDSERIRWPRPEAGGSSSPLQTPVATLGERPLSPSPLVGRVVPADEQPPAVGSEKVCARRDGPG